MEEQRNLHQLVARVEQILDRELPEVESSAYLEVMALFPYMVRQETPVLDFLRAEDFDCTAAAKRLALYWKTRQEIFGSRWMRPMNQTGSGALTPEQVQIFRTGYIQVVRNNWRGEKVIWVDHSRLPTSAPIFQPQVLMYFFTVIACEEIQTKGVLCLFVVRSHERTTLQLHPEMAQQLRKAMPFKLKPFVVAQAYEPGKEHLLDYLGFKRERMATTNFNFPSQPCIKADSVAGTFEKLQLVGFDRECLPRELGGNLDASSHFDNWVRVRLSLEEVMASAPPIRNSEIANHAMSQGTCTGAIAMRSVTTNVATHASAAAAAAAAAANNANARTPALTLRRDFTPSTQYAHNVNKTLAQLKDDAERLEGENRALRQDIKRQQAFLAQARLIVSLYSVGSLHYPPLPLSTT